MAEVFAWQVDFGLDVRVNDTFSLIYDDRYRDGTYVMPDAILAARFVNDGTTYEAYRYERSDGTIGYFDQDGNSLEKILLKTPNIFTLSMYFFFFNDTATTEIYTLSLHDALPISAHQGLA